MALTKVTERIISDNLSISGIATAATSVVGSAVTSNSTGIDIIGIVTATSFKGDGSGLTGVVQSDTPLGNNTASTTFYETDNSVSISTSTTLSRASSNPGIIYTKFNEIIVGTAPGTVELVVAADEELVIDAYQLSIDPS
tara:strand:+ start:76 stop:495 length:420 start_codon:yes stop_codon:yes gene_type:complete